MKTQRKTHIINAQGRPLGRLAVEVALLLRGKQKSDFSPEKDVGDFVKVQNFSKTRFTGNKLAQKKYFSHSGYLGSLKAKRLEEMFEKKPAEVLWTAVRGMLPATRLRAGQMKRLTIEL